MATKAKIPLWYTITMYKHKFKGTEDTLIALLSEMCDKWVLGNEIGGNSGLEHWQIKAKFHNIEYVKKFFEIVKGVGDMEQSMITGFTGYEEKEGNFLRSWEKALWKYQKLEFNEWELDIMSRLANQNDRELMILCNEEGGAGKTTFAKMLVARHLATYIPPLESAIDYMAMAMAKPSKFYVIDVPRAEEWIQKYTDKHGIEREKISQKARAVFSCCEQIKNGYLYDKRYQWRELWIEPPTVLVLTNARSDEIPTGLLSQDRWNVLNLINGEVWDEI